MHKKRQRLTRFELNDAQRMLLEVLQTHNRVIVLKARQLGVSTLTRAWQFWNAYCSGEPTQHAVVSHTRQSAEELHRMDKTFYGNLPVKLQRPLERASVRTLKFKDTGAELRTYTSGGKGGTRSYAMNSAHLSEFAFYQQQEEVMATVMAAVGQGQVVIESTPNAWGDMFHNLVLGAIDGSNEWKLVFFPWFIHPDYVAPVPRPFRLNHEEKDVADAHMLSRERMAWRRKQIRTLGKDKFTREYPATIEECFRAASSFFFDHAKLDAIEAVDLGSHEHRMYSDSMGGDRYVMGVDVGAGLGGKAANSAVTVVSVSTRQPVYHYVNNKISPARFADELVKIWERYNQPKLIVEANNHGILVLHRLRELKVKNLYMENGKDFMTTNKTRPLLFGAIREAIEEGAITHLDKLVVKELRKIVYKNDRPKAPRGHHDDVTISMALCYYVLAGIPLEVTHSVKRALMEEHISRMRAKAMKRTLPWSVTGGDGVGGY